MAHQIDLWNNPAPPQGMKPEEQVRYILEQHPEARNDDATLLIEHGRAFAGLDAILDEDPSVLAP